METDIFDELRKALLERKPVEKSPEPAQPARAAMPIAPPPPAALQTAAPGRTAPSSKAPSVPSVRASGSAQTGPSPVAATLLSDLKGALAGRVGGSGAPKTGFNPPSWPGTPAPMGPGELPVGLPSESAKVPPRWKRFETGQRMQEAIRNNWSPNPMLIRILEGR